VVAETGWPFKGDDNDVGPSIENAKAYNGNLIAHLRSMVGTPLVPGKSVDTFGPFKTDLTMVRTKFTCISLVFGVFNSQVFYS
jgi:exo-beta-1,3-glucanase (GH17 family)